MKTEKSNREIRLHENVVKLLREENPAPLSESYSSIRNKTAQMISPSSAHGVSPSIGLPLSRKG